MCFMIWRPLFLCHSVQMKNSLVSLPFHFNLPPCWLTAVCLIDLCMFYDFTFFCFLSFCLFLLCCFFPSVLVMSPLFLLCTHVLVFVLGSSPLLGFIKPSGESVVPRGPQLSALSLRCSSCFSPALPRCRSNPLAANGKPECHGHLSEGQLCHGRRGGRLRQPVPHPAVLPIHRVALQQVGSRAAARGRPGPLALSRQHPEGPKVRTKETFRTSSDVLMRPFALLPFHLHWTYWGPDSPSHTWFCQKW